MHLLHAARRAAITLAHTRRATGLFTVLFVTIVLAPPFITTLVLLHEGAPFASVQVISRAIAQIVLGAGGVTFYVHWRLSGRDVSGWLAAAAFVTATYGIPFSLLDVAGARTATTLALPGIAELVSVLASLGLVVLAARRVTLPASLDPVALGMLLGLGAVMLQAVLLTLEVGADPSTAAATTVRLATAGAGVVTAGVLAGIANLPGWASTHLSIGVLAIVLTDAVAPSMGTTPLLGLPIAIVHISGAALVAWVALGLCRTVPALSLLSALDTGPTSPGEPPASDWGSAMAAEVRQYEETLHELRSTVAGLAAASRILHDAEHAVPPPTRVRLERMQADEVARLERLLAGRAHEPPTVLDLDDVVLPVVTSLRARGHQVQCEASGVRALGRADHVAEAVHILLDNAARHSEGSAVSLEMETTGPYARITVADEGPGVPEHLSGVLFEWGTQRVGSQGRGIGLHIASRLVGELGGTLQLDSARRPRGAAFIITLPLAEEDATWHAHAV